MDLVNHTLVVAMASRLFNIYDIRKMDTPTQQRESSLKFMTRSIACMSDGQGTCSFVSLFDTFMLKSVDSGFATASVEGRIAVEYFDPSPAAQEKKYAFKCHRQTIDDVDHVWPVNSLAFHPMWVEFPICFPSYPDPLTPTDTTRSHLQDLMELSPSGTTRSKNGSVNIPNSLQTQTPLHLTQSHRLRSTAMEHSWQ